MNGPIVALLTDFGSASGPIATMKSAIHSHAPGAHIVEITHEIPPKDTTAAAYQLLATYRYHSPGTLFLCSVDPGSISNNRFLYVDAGGWRFLAPDNGILSWVLDHDSPSRILDISSPPDLPEFPSHTFPGRDLLAPVAGRILAGEPPEHFGSKIDKYQGLAFPAVRKIGSLWRAEVIAVNSFGNLVTNLKSEELQPLKSRSKIWFECGSSATTVRGLLEPHGVAEPGKLIAIEGSAGFVEISIRDGNAAKETRMSVGDEIAVHFRS